MSNELKQFYREIWAWIQDGCPKHVVFRKNAALCGTLALWGEMCASRNFGLYSEQSRIFDSLGGSTNYPFNHDLYDWKLERDYGSFYQNPKRLAFIKEMAELEMIRMLCHCGAEYVARPADIKGGLATSCSTHCEVVRRTHGKREAKPIDRCENENENE